MPNPIISHLYTADPAAIVHQGVVYLYTGHDEPPEGIDDYVMKDWRCFSSTNLVDWQEHPVPLKATDFNWASGDAYASQVIERNGRFYWYVAVSHESVKGKAIGVAVSDSPVGPFTDERGTALVTNDLTTAIDSEMDDLDPTVIIDEDGQAFLFWGNQQCYYAALHENMMELTGPIKTIDLPGFAEGAWIHKRNNWYYLSYGYGHPERVAYAMSRSIHGPWVFKGILNDLVQDCATNSPAILEFKGKSYFIYHNAGLPGGGSHRRSVCIDYLYYNQDETMKRVQMTREGIQLA